MLGVIEAQAHNIFTWPWNGSGKLHFGYGMYCANGRVRFDLTKVSTSGLVQDGLQDQLPLFVVFDQLKHLIWSNDGEGVGSQVNVNNLVVLNHTQVRLGNFRRRKTDKFHT